MRVCLPCFSRLSYSVGVSTGAILAVPVHSGHAPCHLLKRARLLQSPICDGLPPSSKNRPEAVRRCRDPVPAGSLSKLRLEAQQNIPMRYNPCLHPGRPIRMRPLDCGHKPDHIRPAWQRFAAAILTQATGPPPRWRSRSGRCRCRRAPGRCRSCPAISGCRVRAAGG